MAEFISIILSNKYYTMIAVSLIIVILFLVIKKLMKLFIYAAILLIAFLAYIYYTGKTLDSVVQPVGKAIEKAEKLVK
jgi:hypothetical protein